MTPLLENQQFEDPAQGRHFPSRPELCSRLQERMSFRLFPELESRDRTRNEPPLIGRQSTGKSVWNTARLVRVVFKVIEPYLEIDWRHG
jgi:hypothetical protein